MKYRVIHRDYIENSSRYFVQKKILNLFWLDVKQFLFADYAIEFCQLKEKPHQPVIIYPK